TLYLEVGNPQNRVELYNWFSAENQVEQVTFADGTVWDAGVMQSLVVTAPATSFDDILNLSDDADVLDALAGDDAVYGNGGDDILIAGDGNDYLEGGAGHNLLIGGPGDDFAYASEADSRNLFIGGAGNDAVLTNASGTVISFNAGDGEDVIYSNSGDAFTLSLGGVSAADITLSTDGSSIRIGLSSTDGLRTYSYGFPPESWPQGTLQIIGSDIRTYDLNAVVRELRNGRPPTRLRHISLHPARVRQWVARSPINMRERMG
ncbi:MAG: calcium-binding protein, partial [Betaproteobacteria bacterium]